MRKNIKKKLMVIISMVLVLSMLGGSCVFAADNCIFRDNEWWVVNTATLTKDLENGDSVFEFYSVDGLISRGYLDRSEGVLYEESYDAAGSVTQYVFNLRSYSRVFTTVLDQTRTATAGNIGYELYDSGNYYVGTTSLEVYGETGYTSQDSYDLYGSYHDMVHLLSWISYFTGLYGLATELLAQGIIDYLSSPYDFIDLLIPHLWLDCDTYRVNWYCSEYGTGYTGSMVSYKYVCWLEGNYFNTYYNSWYDIPALANHNVGLGVVIYQSLASVYYPSPVSWNVYY